MTTKHLTGAYPGGYTLSAAYNRLDIGPGASVGGAGVYAALRATILNHGIIDATTSLQSGISLHAGGRVVNGSATDTKALIEGTYGINADGPSRSTITNFGTIEGRNAGVFLRAGGSVTNGSATDTKALIESNYTDVVGQGASVTVLNYGTIKGGNGLEGNVSGIFLSNSGGVVTNGSVTDTTALIENNLGVTMGGALATLANFGTIWGAGLGQFANGIALSGGGTVSNGSSTDVAAMITAGAYGVNSSGSLTLTNYGRILGNYGGIRTYDGIITNGSASDTTALIKGTNYGVSAGRFSSLSAAVTNFGTIESVGTSSPVSVYGAVILWGGGVVTNGSTTDTAALIKGADGIDSLRGPLTLTNYGTIDSTVGLGLESVDLGNGGVVTNGSAVDRQALIEFGVACSGGIATITNFGTIGSVSFDSAVDVLVVEAQSFFKNGGSGGGGTLDLASGVGTISQSRGKLTVSGSMRTSKFNDFETVEVASGAEFTLIGRGRIGARGSDVPNVLNVQGTVDAIGTLDVTGTIAGTGTMAFAGGASALNAGASVDVANLSLSGGAAVSANESLTYAGAFSMGLANLTVGAGDNLSLSGTSTFAAGAVVRGAGTLTLTNATVAGLSVSAAAVIDDVGVVDQTGTIVLTENATGPRLTIANGGTYELDGDVGFARRASNTPVIVVDGLLIKSAGTGISSVGVVVGDNGTIEAATGTLSFVAGVTGTGLMKIDAGATLQFANTVASTLTASFNGAGGTLALSNANDFAATISGFATGETIDLVNTAATSAVLNGSDQLVITNGTTAVATLQLTGTYTGDTFATASDGHGGTAITVSTGAAVAPVHGFVAAMAAISPAAGAGHASGWRPEEALRPLLVSPRAALA